ncbi:MAG TPA: hypothetical protein VN788_00130 [Verrucomicrobiae bacterium]|nr:hypothetical protein [Verrucomicrobiae bacterium]
MPSPWTTANLKPDYLPGVRLPVRSALVPLIGKMPFWVDLFNEQLAAMDSDENRFTMTEDYWWAGTLASIVGVGGVAVVHPAFAFQLFQLDNGGDEASTSQQKPVNQENYFGTAQKPFYLSKPVLFPAGTQLLCRVQNLQSGSAANLFNIQIVMMGYMA